MYQKAQRKNILISFCCQLILLNGTSWILWIYCWNDSYLTHISLMGFYDSVWEANRTPWIATGRFNHNCTWSINHAVKGNAPLIPYSYIKFRDLRTNRSFAVGILPFAQGYRTPVYCMPAFVTRLSGKGANNHKLGLTRGLKAVRLARGRHHIIYHVKQT